MITTILWDIDGTLLDFSAAESTAIHTLFREFGFGECSDERMAQYSRLNRRYWDQLERGEITKPELLVGRFAEFFAGEGVDAAMAAVINARYQDCLGDTIVFRDDSYEIVRSLRGCVKQYAVSNGTAKAQTKKLRLSGLDRLMDGIFLSDQLGAEKPDIRFFEKVFAAIPDQNRSQILIVGDSLTSDIRGGRGAGILTCWYNPAHKARLAGDAADWEIDDLHAVPALIRGVSP